MHKVVFDYRFLLSSLLIDLSKSFLFSFNIDFDLVTYFVNYSNYGNIHFEK